MSDLLDCGHPAACEKSVSGFNADGSEQETEWCEWCAQLTAAQKQAETLESELATVTAERDRERESRQKITAAYDAALQIKVKLEGEDITAFHYMLDDAHFPMVINQPSLLMPETILAWHKASVQGCDQNKALAKELAALRDRGANDGYVFFLRTRVLRAFQFLSIRA